MGETSYQECPTCRGTLVTERYLARYGRCQACYERENTPVDVRIARALRR